MSCLLIVLFQIDYKKTKTKGRTDQLKNAQQSKSGAVKLNNLENHDDMHRAFGFETQNTTNHISTEILIPVTDISLGFCTLYKRFLLIYFD